MRCRIHVRRAMLGRGGRASGSRLPDGLEFYPLHFWGAMVDIRASAASRSEEYPRWTVEQQIRRIPLALLLVAWLPVHDSIAPELSAALVEGTQWIVVAAMESLRPGFTVPLKVEIHTGRTWAECKQIKPGALRIGRRVNFCRGQQLTLLPHFRPPFFLLTGLQRGTMAGSARG